MACNVERFLVPFYNGIVWAEFFPAGDATFDEGTFLVFAEPAVVDDLRYHRYDPV